jgi:hypothetical protein
MIAFQISCVLEHISVNTNNEECWYQLHYLSELIEFTHPHKMALLAAKPWAKSSFPQFSGTGRTQSRSIYQSIVSLLTLSH